MKKTELNEFLDLTIEEIFADRFSRYSKYVIQDRALPDVRDGLKPVQRRILYSMNKEGNTFNKQFRKSAKTVGNVIGNYHPHGDTSVYDAMTRMSQNWKVNEQLVIMHGNNGSIDGDNAAAMRYTEAKLSTYSEFMLENIEENTVGMVPNFDDTELEPVVLPTKIPNLLVNGSSGISSGYATDIPPHNLEEVLKGAIYVNENKKITLEEVMKIIPGPDFPTGGIIQGEEGIKNAYETGKGKIIIQANYKIEKNSILFTSIPYEINKSTLLQKIDLIRIDKKVEGISEVLDQSDQHGIEILINCKKDANKQLIVNYLLKNTDLQKNYNFNMIAISDRKPKQLGIIEMLESFIAHREEVILLRSENRLEISKNKLHIVEGMVYALDILDEIIEIIRSSNNKSNSKENLIKKYKFTEEQAEAIVMMQLYRLSNTDITTLVETKEELQSEIKILENIINKNSVLKKLISTELNEVLNKVSSPRRSSLEKEIHKIEINEIDLIKSEKVLVSVTKHGYIKRVTPRSYLASTVLSSTNEGDVLTDVELTNTKHQAVIFFNDGTYILVPVNDIPDLKQKEIGKHISSLAKVNDGVHVVKMITTNNFTDIQEFITTTKLGYTTRMKFEELNSNKKSQKIQWQKLKANDEIIGVTPIIGNDLGLIVDKNIIFVTSLGRYIKLAFEEVEEYQIKRVGKRIMTLRKNEELVGVEFLKSDLVLLTNKNGYFKISDNDILTTEKPKQLVTNTKTNPHEIIKLLVTNEKEILLKLATKEEKIIEVKSLKNSKVEEKYKNIKEEEKIENIEKIISLL